MAEIKGKVFTVMVENQKYEVWSDFIARGTFAKNEQGEVRQIKGNGYITNDLTVRKAIAAVFGHKTFKKTVKKQEETVKKQENKETKTSIIKVERVWKDGFLNYKVTYQSGKVRFYDIGFESKNVSAYIKANGYEDSEVETNEEFKDENEKFKVGGNATDCDFHRVEKVLKVTRCYVWITCGTETKKLKIHNIDGLEYVKDNGVTLFASYFAS